VTLSETIITKLTLPQQLLGKKTHFMPLFMKIRQTVSPFITGHERTDVVST